MLYLLPKQFIDWREAEVCPLSFDACFVKVHIKGGTYSTKQLLCYYYWSIFAQVMTMREK